MKVYTLLCSFALLLWVLPGSLNAQDTLDLEQLLLQENTPQKEYVRNAFKSSRVINGHSMEMLGKGVLDMRILHRFGLLNSGFGNLFGLDQASMRMGLDYGLGKHLTLGIGRSTYKKEIDGFIKARMKQQSRGKYAFPVSLLWVSGITLHTLKINEPKLDDFAYRIGYYHQAIIGRKMGTAFTLQISPTWVHRNLVETKNDFNNMVALGIGARCKITNRMAFILDTYPILYGVNPDVNQFPLSIGLDIETGGHVFQLHISNARGMNEKAFIAETSQRWDKGQIHFGFNLSRVFTVVRNQSDSW